MTTEQLPPQSRDAERALLGSMLRDNSTIDDVVRWVRREFFYADAHQKLFAAMMSLHDRRQPIDLVTLAELLNERNHIEDIGRHVYLSELWDAAPTAANAEYYARIVRDKAILRFLVHAGTEIVRDAYDQAMPADDLLELAEQKIFDIGSLQVDDEAASMATVISEVYDQLDARGRPDQRVRVSTGFEKLDELTAGFHNGQLIVLAARTSVGKTALALEITRRVGLIERMPVLFFTLEQTRTELGERMACALARINTLRVQLGNLNEHETVKLAQAGDRLRQAPIFVNDKTRRRMDRIASQSKRMKLRHGVRLVVVDYLQEIQFPGHRLNQYERVTAASNSLRDLASDVQLPVLALAQLNRQPTKRQDPKPVLSDLKESGAIEQDAHVVLLLWPSDDEGVMNLDIAKNRNGPTGELRLVYEKWCGQFENERIQFQER